MPRSRHSGNHSTDLRKSREFRQTRREHRSGGDDTAEDRSLNLVMGRHPVLEALRQGRPMAKIWLLPGPREGSLREICGLAEARHIPVRETPRAKLDVLTENLGGNHQGVVAEVARHPTLSLEALLQQVEATVDPMLLILDGIQDPHNLGAILRVAEAAGMTNVSLIIGRHSADVNRNPAFDLRHQRLLIMGQSIVDSDHQCSLLSLPMFVKTYHFLSS